MAKVVTESFRIESTNEFVDSFADAAKNDYYIMASSQTGDATAITNSQSDIREFQRRVIFGNKVDSSDVRYMFERRPWTSGTIYDAFDDEQDMSVKNFYVTVLDGTINETSYKVFKCIRNNGGQPSTNSPSTALSSTTNYETTEEDGYVWKYMFDVPPAEYILFGTSKFLPYVPSSVISSSAQQGVGDVLIDASPAGAFSSYVVGPAGSPAQAGVVSAVSLNSTTYRIELDTSQEVKSTSGEYKNMYLRLGNGSLLDIVDSSTPAFAVSGNKLLYVDVTTSSIPNSFVGQSVEVLPKIKISNPNDDSGTQALAYGIMDSAGNLINVNFKTKGSGYDFAIAELQQPGQEPGTVVEGSQLRVIHSPNGGHGFNPIHELYMSRVETVTTFFSDITTNTPSTNTYTKVGVVKNPHFKIVDTFGNTLSDDQKIELNKTYKITNLGVGELQAPWNTIAGTVDVVYSVGSVITAKVINTDTNGGQVMEIPDSLDNRIKIVKDVKMTPAQAAAGFYISQTENDEICEGSIHEVKYTDPGNTGSQTHTELYVTDAVGAYNKTFNTNTNIQIKETKQSSSTAFSSTINSVTQSVYTPFTGELLHFVDFDPITRTESSKEKVKLIFDF